MSTPLGSSQWMYSSGEEPAIGQSLKFNDDESQYLSWTPAAAGNRKTWTWSGWVKRGNLGTTVSLMDALQTTGVDWTRFHFNTSNQLSFAIEISNTNIFQFITTQVFRDTSAWYHIVAAYDSTQATSTDRFKLYVNGEQITDFSTETYGAQNTDSHFNHTIEHNIGAVNNGIWFFDGYMSDIHFIDGQALDASSFGETVDGYWKAIDYAGTYGTNGFHLTFQDDVVSEGFNTVTYRGTGSTQSVSGLGLAADLVWIKRRDFGLDHQLYDTVRGVLSGKLSSNTTGSEEYDSVGLSSFDSDGFTMGNRGHINASGQTYVAWAWDAGSGSPVSNTDGSITSTVKANPDYGFSIVTWTATTGTVGHGLGAAPELIIEKRRSSTSDWIVGTTAIDGSNDYLRLNTTVGKTDSASASPTATVFTPNTGSGDVVAYCFNSVAGYSSIGSYEGDGTTNGSNVVTLGFKPAFVMIKNVDDAASWHMFDNTRDTFSPIGKYLTADTSDAESTLDLIEFTNTGFAPIFNGNAVNHTGETYIYMAFADTREAAFWKDVSGQGNHWTPNNLDYRDSLIDSPANNFATLQPTAFVNTGGANSAQSLSEGNLRYTGTTSEGRSTPATIRVTSGKYYAEATKTSGSGSVNVDFIVNDTYVAGKSTSTTGDIIMAAVDVDAGKYWSGLNGTWDSSGDPATGANPTGTFAANSSFTFGGRVYDTARVGHFNFGQDSTFAGATTAGGNTDDNGIGDFAYAPPSGYLALCTANLPTPSIVDGSEHFNTVLVSGNSGTQSVTGVGFQPDFTWNKTRNVADNHILIDSIRGDYALRSNDTIAEYATGVSWQFAADGFTMTGTTGELNYSGRTYAAWNWKAGGTAVSNTDGSITSQVSANVDAGFSIVNFTGTGGVATIGHGLGAVPKLIILKGRTITDWWGVYHASLGNTKALQLNTTNAQLTSSTFWNDTTPTSSVFTIANQSAFNQSGQQTIAYCFAEVDGFSKVGSYTGNGSSDGTFVYTGFRPAFVMVKRATGGTGGWQMEDSIRNPSNSTDKYLDASSSSAESSFEWIEFISNGFKLTSTGAGSNFSGDTYIYLAFAETPFKYANAR